jgi:large subunit ribosomal protein L21
MYAVIKTGGKQYAVERGDRLFIERLNAEPGAKIEFDKVLYLNADDFVKVGTPYLDAVRVLATAIENGKAKKVVIFKYKAKKDYRKKQGHRQPYTLVEIDAITVDGEVIGKPIAKAEAEEPEQALPETEPETAERAETAAEDLAVAEELSIATETAEAEKETSAAETPAEAEAEQEAEVSTEKPARRARAKAPAKTEAETAESSAEKPARRTPKPKAPEKTEADQEESESSAEKPARKTTRSKAAKPKVEQDVEHTDAATVASEEED